MSRRTIRRHSWPLDPATAVALLQDDLPGWVVTYRPGPTGIYRAELLRDNGGLTAIESALPGAVYATIEQFCDEDPA
ncbi:hypothetical protein AB0F72_17845 [Actinoplanes sp. NPDC023936]|uniref:hypothetical protein n=1 Tax=Actinoplanes sp. NPDC023936 TaxID=3154910 RepID=UPI0033F5109A